MDMVLLNIVAKFNNHRDILFYVYFVFIFIPQYVIEIIVGQNVRQNVKTLSKIKKLLFCKSITKSLIFVTF